MGRNILVFIVCLTNLILSLPLCLLPRIAPNGVDLVLDCMCGVDANIGYNLLKPMGRYVLYGKYSSYIGSEMRFESSSSRKIRDAGSEACLQDLSWLNIIQFLQPNQRINNSLPSGKKASLSLIWMRIAY